MELLDLLSEPLADGNRLTDAGVDLTEEVRRRGRLGLHEPNRSIEAAVVQGL